MFGKRISHILFLCERAVYLHICFWVSVSWSLWSIQFCVSWVETPIMLCATTRHTREMILVNELVRSVIKRGNNLLPVFSISKKKKPCNACKGYSVPKGPQLDPYFDREVCCLTLVHIVGQIIVWPRLVVSEQGMVQHLPLGLLSSDLPLQLCFLVEVSHRKLNAITNQCVSLTIQRNLF